MFVRSLFPASLCSLRAHFIVKWKIIHMSCFIKFIILDCFCGCSPLARVQHAINDFSMCMFYCLYFPSSCFVTEAKVRIKAEWNQWPIDSIDRREEENTTPKETKERNQFKAEWVNIQENQQSKTNFLLENGYTKQIKKQSLFTGK